jgi:hypothetical protein
MAINVRAMANAAIQAVNPDERCHYQSSIGNVTGADGVRVPQYAAPQPVIVQLQATTQDDLKRANALELQGEKLKAWLPTPLVGLVRADQRGGDLLTRDRDGTLWLVLSVIETWPDWTSVVLVKQMPAAKS